MQHEPKPGVNLKQVQRQLNAETIEGHYTSLRKNKTLQEGLDANNKTAPTHFQPEPEIKNRKFLSHPSPPHFGQTIFFFGQKKINSSGKSNSYEFFLFQLLTFNTEDLCQNPLCPLTYRNTLVDYHESGDHSSFLRICNTLLI